MPSTKTKRIENFYSSPINKLIRKLYVNQRLSTTEIAEKIQRESEIRITPRFLQMIVKSLSITRPLSDAFRLAIRKGRKDYHTLRKPIRAEESRRGISLKLRYIIFQRDGSRCRLCGRSSEETTLEVDHIHPVVRGGTNDLDNLRTLCRECNRGKKFAEHEK